MITGLVNVRGEPIVELHIQSPNGRETRIQAAADTGFNGALTLPPRLIAELALPWRRRARATLADGAERFFEIYEGRVLWDRKLRRVAVDAMDVDPLVGLSLLRGYELTIQNVPGGDVVIRDLAS